MIDEREVLLTKIVRVAAAHGFDTGDLQAILVGTGSDAGQAYFLKALAHSPHSLIFRHEFVRAFFGEGSILEEYPLSDGSGEYLKILMPAWQAHLRKMVLLEEPLLYFKNFVKDI